jgi:hypothetical protein
MPHVLTPPERPPSAARQEPFTVDPQPSRPPRVLPEGPAADRAGFRSAAGADRGAGVFLLVVAFAASATGNLGPLLELALLTPALILLLIRCGVRGASLIPAIVALAICVAVMPPATNRWTGLSYIVVVLAVAHATSSAARSAARATTGGRSELRRYLIVATAVLLIDVAVLANPAARRAVDDVVRGWSESLTGLFGGPRLPLGVTYWSLPVLVAYLAVAFARAPLSRMILTIAAGCVALLTYLSVVGPLQTYMTSRRRGHSSRGSSGTAIRSNSDPSRSIGPSSQSGLGTNACRSSSFSSSH